MFHCIRCDQRFWSGLQIAGVPCPPDCKNDANHFDGCHRCDCGTPTKVQ